MDLAVSFPTEALGADPVKIKDFVQGAEQIGYTQVQAGEHVIGADPKYRSDVPYTIDEFTHEPMTLMMFIAAHTQKMLLVPSILILPQRQTALVAKQAAEIDLLSGGRLRLGVGIGNHGFEYEALGQDWSARAKRIEEQMAFLRALWTQRSVNFEGKWDSVAHAGINPMPIQQPIPLWVGGGSVESALKRIGRTADGWLPTSKMGEDLRDGIQRFKKYAEEVGHDASKLAIVLRGTAASGTPDDWRKDYADKQSMGGTVITINGGDGTVDEMMKRLKAYKEAVTA